MIELNSKQRKYLERLAHDLNPVVIVGANGISDGVEQMIENTLESHELIKIKFNEYKDEKVELSTAICEKLDATLVRVIGNIAIVYRKRTEKPAIKLPK